MIFSHDIKQGTLKLTSAAVKTHLLQEITAIQLRDGKKAFDNCVVAVMFEGESDQWDEPPCYSINRLTLADLLAGRKAWACWDLKDLVNVLKIK
jgi:hypothetical protein